MTEKLSRESNFPECFKICSLLPELYFPKPDPGSDNGNSSVVVGLNIQTYSVSIGVGS